MFNRSNYLEETKYNKKIKAIITYFVIFATWLASVLITGRFLIFGMGLTMLAVACVTSYFIPSDRDLTLKSYKWTMLGYSAFGIFMNFVSVWALNDTLAGNGLGTAYNFANTSFDFAVILIPLGFVTWQLKKFTIFYGGKHSKRRTIEYIKKHGNDGRK